MQLWKSSTFGRLECLSLGGEVIKNARILDYGSVLFLKFILFTFVFYTFIFYNLYERGTEKASRIG